jgi:hypothetical protein
VEAARQNQTILVLFTSYVNGQRVQVPRLGAAGGDAGLWAIVEADYEMQTMMLYYQAE